MKKYFLISLILITAYLDCTAQSDTIQIKLKTGSVEKIAVDDLLSIKFDNLTSVSEAPNPSAFSRLSNYPNPFSESTAIEFELAQEGIVELSIFDVLGNLIKKISCENCTIGKNIINWDTKDMNGNSAPIGTYFYEIRSGSQFVSKKMLLVR